MTRLILTYGLISGFVSILGIIASIIFPIAPAHSDVWLGYLVMLVGLSAVLVGVKQHRDQALGGVIRFWPALLLGLSIALIATAIYALAWEGYLALTGYRFMDDYVAHQLAAKRAAGVTGAAYAQAAASLEALRRQYSNPALRLMMTAAEIFPVGVLVSVVSAALLRNPRFLPARSRATA